MMDVTLATFPPLQSVISGLAAGLGISLVIGLPAVSCFNCWAKHRYLPPEPPRPANSRGGEGIPSSMTGTIERLVFTLVVIAAPSQAVLGMGGWLGLKMAANWNKDIPPSNENSARDEKLARNSHAILALLSGVLSMAFAGAGGWVARLIMGLTVAQS